jgi:hypothetical protein
VSAGTAELVLPRDGMTSAGVYEEDGRLIRTLWSARAHGAGPLRIQWDGRDDDGAPAPATRRYVVRAIAHNVRYVWDGVIGNTSRELTGAAVHRSMWPIQDMALDDAGNAFFVVGYAEGQRALHRFKTADPQRRLSLLREDYRREFRYVATDGRLAYFANTGVAAARGSFMRQPQTFVAATDVGTDELHRFPSGTTGIDAENKWSNVIDYDADDRSDVGFRSAPTGLAVQKYGPYLFVAHARLGEIRVFDKRTGERVAIIPAAEPTDLDVAPDESLWVLDKASRGGAIVRLRLVNGEWREDSRVQDVFDDAVALGVSPLDGTVVVVDAGSEQLKAFDAEGRAVWTFGQAGGYRAGGPEVTTDKFSFSGRSPYLAFAPDGSFWVGDPGNARNLHFSPGREFLEQILYLPRNYVVAVNSANPRRVFSHFLEFEVDYAQPIASSWRLVANWQPSLDGPYVGDRDGFQAVHTLSNGRTYGVVHRFDLRMSEVVELTGQGLRPTGTKLDFGTKLYADGSLRWHIAPFDAGLIVYERSLDGFAKNGDPRWGRADELARVARLRPDDPFYHDVPGVNGVNEPTYPITSGGIILAFNPGRSAGFHLGGLLRGGDRWLWRASPSGSWELGADGQIVNKDGRYEIANGVQYLGNVVMAAGRHVLYGYHGEAWRSGQANQWLHFYDNGLFIGQFGRPGLPGNGYDAPAEAAGNSFSAQLVTHDGGVYLWHNDEHAHGGVHRWRLEGADAIELLEAPIAP